MENQPRFLHDGDKWVLAEDIPDIDFQFSQIWLSSFVNDLEKTIGVNYKKVISIYNDGYNLKFYYGEKDSEHIAQVILDKIINERFGTLINSKVRLVADSLRMLIDPIDQDYLKNISNEELCNLYERLDEVHTEFYVWSWLPNAVDMFHPHLTSYLKKILEKKLASESDVNAALVGLSFWPEKSFIQDEHESILRLAARKKIFGEDDEFVKMLQVHHNNFFYLKHLWIGKDGVSSVEEYKQVIDRIIIECDPVLELEKEQLTWSEGKAMRDEYEAQLSLDENEIDLFRNYAEFAFTKTYRRKVQLYWAYKMDFIFNEIVNRSNLNFIETRFLMPEEVKKLLLVDNYDIKKIVQERVKHCVYYAEKGLDVVVTGEGCKEYEETIIEDAVGEIREFKGQVACTGKVKGIVKIVNTPEDIAKVNTGDILVSIATNPDVLPAMKKAAAFVTEQGGITSHAAIVAREMKKPCIIGTKIATKVLKDGDIVEVDADNGIVKILS